MLRYLLLLLVLSLLSIVPSPCLSARPRQQHNVWYNGLFISGIAVDERTGDVFFSDAAGNRIIHQSRNGSVLHVYDACGVFSPMQLAYHAGRLYVATGAYNKVAVIDVQSGTASFSSPPSYLSSASALTIHNATGHVLVVDGWGLQVELWEPDSDVWTYHADFSIFTDLPPTPHYFATGAVRHAAADDWHLWLTDPTQPWLFYVFSNQYTELVVLPAMVGSTAVQAVPVDDQSVDLYVLSQPQLDGPMHVQLIDHNGVTVSNWTAPGTGGAAVPFYGWAMFVDSNGSMYVGDHGVDAVSSPYGRIVKLAANGSEVGSWSMSDGVAYAFSSVWYEGTTTMGGSCALWMADSKRGVLRVTAEGAPLLPFDAAPVDPADNLAARFTGMAEDAPIPSLYVDSTFVLLDTSSPTSTKLWRYQPNNHSYTLLNTTAAQLGAHITGLAVDVNKHLIYVSDTRTRTVVRLDCTGALDTTYNTSDVGFVEPGCIMHVDGHAELYMVDSGYNGNGAFILLDSSTGAYGLAINDTTPPMFRPLSLTVDTSNSLLYVADSNGYVFQFSTVIWPYTQQAVHQAVPAATSIVSMTVSGYGHVYMLDSYSRRLIVLSFDTTVWTPGNPCVPATPPSSSSTIVPSVVPSLSSSSSWSGSSSTGALSPPAASIWSTSAVLAVAVMGVVAVASGGACFYGRWKRRQRSGEGGSGDADEWLIAGHDDEREQAEAEEWAYVEEEYVQPAASTRRRYEYYVARYEVVAALGDMGQLNTRSLSRPPRHPLSIQTSRPSWPSPRTSLSRRVSYTTHSATSPTSELSHISSASSSSSEDTTPATAAYTDNDTPAHSGVSTTSATSQLSPQYIEQLQAAWPTSLAPTFIDSVTDLTILGEGSSGVVYRGVYRGQACVVKLAKSAALTSLAWREWQCHLCLPPHRHLVRFLGALPMSSTSYLVLVFVRQGSLHSLLCSSQAARSVYSRPYSVMRCMRDMCAALHHIHLSGIVHRDVSCRNILVDSDGCMVLCDLGLAIQLQWRHDRLDSDTSAQSRQATLLHVQDDSLQTAVPVRWTSPESLASSHYSTHSDVWSLGVAVWEMTAGGALPYADTQHSTGACIRQIVARQLTLHIHEQWGREHTLSRAEQQLADRVRRLTHAALQYDVQQRPDSHTMQQAVESEWNEWQAEWASEADELHDWWAAYHAEVQRRLGPPCRYD